MEGKSPQLPSTPTYQEDPRYRQGINQLSNLGNQATSFQGLPSEMTEAISTSPKSTSMFLEGLKAELEPIFRDIRRDTMNQLAANNQLESSTTASKFGEIESDLQKKYISQSTTFGLADIDRALQNRMSLFGMGLDTTKAATGMAGESESTKNQFNLQNYENVVAKDLYDKQKNLSGWGKALSYMSPLGHDIFEMQGYENVPGIGVWDALPMATSMFGGGLPGSSVSAGSSAGNF